MRLSDPGRTHCIFPGKKKSWGAIQYIPERSRSRVRVDDPHESLGWIIIDVFKDMTAVSYPQRNSPEDIGVSPQSVDSHSRTTNNDDLETKSAATPRDPAWVKDAKKADLRSQPWRYLSPCEDSNFDDGPDEVVVHKTGIRENTMNFSGSLAA